jgi:hypothetical protein
MPWEKGQSGNKRGRPKGTKDKIPRDLRVYVLDVADKLQKEGRGLHDWAKENETEFWTKIFRGVLPKPIEVSGPDGAPIRSRVDATIQAGPAISGLIERLASSGIAGPGPEDD